LELADKVEVEVASEFEQIFPQKTYAEVVIRTEDGRELTSGPVQPLWEPPNGLPADAELEEKFVGIVEPVLGPQKVQEITRMIWDFEKMDGIKLLINGCIRGQSFKK
jgi:2-methylcitrate dehydratase PrpD